MKRPPVVHRAGFVPMCLRYGYSAVMDPVHGSPEAIDHWFSIYRAFAMHIAVQDVPPPPPLPAGEEPPPAPPGAPIPRPAWATIEGPDDLENWAELFDDVELDKVARMSLCLLAQHSDVGYREVHP